MTNEIAWMLGILLSDGYLNKKEKALCFICKHSDSELMFKLKKILKTKATVKEYPSYKSPQAKLNVYDRKDIFETYINIKQEIPEDKIKGFERHFIRGLFDGDGTLSTRSSRGTFRIAFIDEYENITQWVSNTITNTLKLPLKKCRYVPQSHVYEIAWEGNVARIIAYWLYHGNIDHMSLQRKLDKYRNDVLDNDQFNTLDEEILYASKAFIDENNEIAFKVPGLQTLPWCHRVQNLLSYKTTPVFHNKGKTKYYHLYISNKNLITNTQSA